MSELVKSYQKVSEDGVVENKFLYHVGLPKDYRFDGRSGAFRIGESKIVMDGNSQAEKLVIKPFAFRKGKGMLFGRDKIQDWIELFFVDTKDCVSSMTFNSTNVQPFELFMLEECLYEGLSLTDFELTITPYKVTSKPKDDVTQPTSWFKVKLKGTLMDKSLVQSLADFDSDFKVYRADSAKYDFEYSMVKSHYFSAIIEQRKALELDSTSIAEIEE